MVFGYNNSKFSFFLEHSVYEMKAMRMCFYAGMITIRPGKLNATVLISRSHRSHLVVDLPLREGIIFHF